ncbi:MAG: alpha-hydroxy acid oxidase [Acidobacteriota bacterium]
MGLTARRLFLRHLMMSPLFAADSPEAKPDTCLDVFDFMPLAQKKLTKWHWAYLMTGSDGDLTLKRNSEAFNEIQLRARRFVDISKIDTAIEVFGERWTSPLFVCPVGSQQAFHPEGELATARAAKARGHQMILSNMTSHHVRDVAKAYGRPPWYQLYASDDFAVTTHLVKQADSAGCPVLVLTMDSATASNRETMRRGGTKADAVCQSCHVNSPAGYMKEHPMYDGLADYSKAVGLTGFITWEMIARIREMTKMKLIAKGIVTHEDAEACVAHGIDGIIVSNHGGRQEESLRGTIESLPEVVAAVKGRMPVMLDSGVRRGTDMIKALALGATAVGIGRPYIWGLGAFGQPGVDRVLSLLQDEMVTTMKLIGATKAREIGPTSLVMKR